VVIEKDLEEIYVVSFNEGNSEKTISLSSNLDKFSTFQNFSLSNQENSFVLNKILNFMDESTKIVNKG
jgi:hypothetical protein